MQRRRPDMNRNAVPVIFGEVLFDRFGDQAVLGGAPFNVAWNLRGLGRDPHFIGAVGADELGARVRGAMARWGLGDAGLQEDPQHPTGQVRVTLEAGSPRYEILPDQAYDHIDPKAALASVPERPGVLYHGSLALRGERSRAALEALAQALEAPVFLDVNLRAPWWQREQVQDWMARATWVKLNQEELAALAPVEQEDLDVQARMTLARFDLDALIVTRAEAGAMVLTREGAVHALQAPPVEALADTVGAGDAFSAVALAGLMAGWGWDLILERASLFASRVCTLQGATTEVPGFYAEAMGAWEG
ncbi:carbohydrate kinase family protein [Ectothiorhodospira mobilis]|uniref:carbohydrate kinase family protein n=1 Tax=Ectothiorhodospira mobilis TaxID=195064 RepID=UPI001EE8E4F5|nr:carbohydrate kinase [Ectothiorhodospira mobilis]MCG5536697.1 carbohydrate kinase [Ectothiorhodospira mobilis]